MASFAYSVLCLILFIVAMSVLASLMNDYGPWGHGFAVGVGTGCIITYYGQKIERRNRLNERERRDS